MADDIEDFLREKAALSAGSTSSVTPENASAALRLGPQAGLAPASVMQDPGPVAEQVRQRDNTAVLQGSRSLQSFVASDTTKAAAIGDSYDPLAKLGAWADKHIGLAKAAGSGAFSSVAMTAAQLGVLSPLDRLMQDIQAATKVSNILAGTGTAEDLRAPSMPGQLLGETLTNASKANYTPQTEAERFAALFGSAIPFALFPGTAASKVSGVVLPTLGAYGAQKGVQALGGDEDLQAAAGVVGGLLGVAPHVLGSIKVPWYQRGVVDEGVIGSQARLPAPKEFVTDAEFTPVEPHPGGPENPFIDSITAEQQAISVAEARALVEQTPVAQRSPEVVADFLENHTRVGNEVVWVPPQALLSNYVEGKTTFGHTLSQLVDAKDAGEHLAVPLSQYLAETAGKPEAIALDRQIRHAQDGLSLDEYKSQQEVDAALADNFLKGKETPVIPSLSVMTKVGEKLQGSNPGAIYANADGVQYLVKGSSHETLKSERAINEAQANALYSMATAQANLVHLVDLGNEHGGGLGVASRLLVGAKPFDVNNPGHIQTLRRDYALHAWLANRDVVGLDFDNMLAHGLGIKPIDLGGALRFRGMGEPKVDFGPIPLELAGFKDPAIAPQAAQVFAGMSESEERRSAEDIQWLNPTAIREAITLGETIPFDQDLYDTLIARQKNILERYKLEYPYSEKEVHNAAVPEDTESLFDQLFPEGTDVDSFPEPEALGIMLEPAQQEAWENAKPQIKAAVVQAANELFLSNLFENNKALGMNAKTFKLFSDKVQKEFMQKAAKLWKKTLDNIRKERGREWRAAYAVNQLEVENQVLSEPGIKASHLLRYSNKVEDPLRKDNAFVDAKGNPITFYHGAWHNDIGITPEELAMKKAEFERKNPYATAEFSPNPWRPINYDVISFTTDPEFANNWKKGDYTIGGTPGRDRTIYVTHLKASRPADFRNPADVEKAVQWYIDKGLVGSEYKETFRQKLAAGEYSRWENPKMWADCGFDAAYMLEDPGQSPDKPNACVKDNSQVYFKYQIRPGVEAPSYKLSPEVKKLYPEELWKNLPNIMFSAESGLSADAVALAMDMDSGEALLSALSQVELVRGKTPFRKFVGDLIKQGTMEKTKADVGDVASSEAILAEAKALFAEPDITELLEDRLKLVSQALSLAGTPAPFSKEAVKSVAIAAWEKQTVAVAGNTRALEKQLTRMGKKGQEALLRGNLIEAFKSWQEQLIAKYQLTEAYALQKSYKQVDKTLSRWAKADAIPGMDPAVGALLQKAIQGLHYKLRRDSAELDRFIAETSVSKGFGDISGLVQYMNAMGTPTVEYQLDTTTVGVNDLVLPKMTVQQFKQYSNMLKAIATFGKDENTVIVEGKKHTLNSIRNSVLRNGAQLGEKYTEQQLHDRATTLFGKTKHIVKAIVVANYRMEVPLHWMDGDRHGVLMQTVIDPLMDGKYMEADLVDSWVKSMQAVDKEYKVFDTNMQAVSAPSLMDYVSPSGQRVKVIRTRGDIRAALTYLGTTTGRERLLEGFGWGEEQEAWLLSKATPADKAFAQAYWNENEKLFPLADKMYMRIRGYGVDKQEPREIVFPDGTTLKGGYTHIQYNHALKLTAQSKKDKTAFAQQTSVVDPRYPVTSLPSSGYIQERTTTAGPVDLRVESMAKGVSETIHDISFREPLLNAQKILTDPTIASTMEKVLGPEYVAEVRPWLQYIANTSIFPDPSLAAVARLVRHVTSNIVFTKLAFNPKAALVHSGIGFGHMLNEVKDPVLLSQSLVEVVAPGPEGDALRDFISKHSGEVRTLLWNNERSIADGLAHDAFSGGRLKEWRKIGYIIFTTAKLVESRATWIARYRQELNRTGNAKQAAVIANKAVRDTQGAGSAVDTPLLLRRTNTVLGEFAASIFQTLMGFRNTAPNRFFTMARLIDRGVKTLRANNGDGGGNGPPDDIDTVYFDDEVAPSNGVEDLGKAGSIVMAYVMFAAMFAAFISIYVRGDDDGEHSMAEQLQHKFMLMLGEQTFGSFAGIAAFYLMMEASLEGHDGAGLVQGTIIDMTKALDNPPDKVVVSAIKAFGSPFGIVPDSLANAVQYGIYAAEGKLSEEDASPAGAAQIIVLGRRSDADKEVKKQYAREKAQANTRAW